MQHGQIGGRSGDLTSLYSQPSLSLVGTTGISSNSALLVHRDDTPPTRFQFITLSRRAVASGGIKPVHTGSCEPVTKIFKFFKIRRTGGNSCIFSHCHALCRFQWSYPFWTSSELAVCAVVGENAEKHGHSSHPLMWHCCVSLNFSFCCAWPIHLDPIGVSSVLGTRV